MSSPKRPDHSRGPPSCIFNACRELLPYWQCGRRVRLTTHLHLLARLRKSSVIRLPFSFTACTGPIYLYLYQYNLLLLLPGAELSLTAESFDLFNDLLLPFLSILDASCPIFELHLANVLFDVILPFVLAPKIIVKHICMFMIFDSKLEDKR